MIITRAPLRLSIGGGGTDLPFYSQKFGGSMVSVAIDKYIYVVIEKREFYNNYLIRYSKTETPEKASDIKHTRVKAALEYLGIDEPLEITSMADAPAGSGLGSSSAFLIALLKALHIYKREEVSAKKLAEEASEIEINILKEPIGKQDQYMAAFGGLKNLYFEKNGNVVISPLDVSYSTLEDLENNLLLFNTGITRSASEVISHQAKAAESEDEKMQRMHLIKDVGKQIKICLEKGDVQKVGKWMNVHWESKKRVTDKMSNSNIDKWYEAGIKAGAIGGKLVGAGGGGFLLFYCNQRKKQLRESMKQLGLRELPFRFDQEGAKLIYEGK